MNQNCLGIHASLRANRFEALEPLRQAIACRFGKVNTDVALGLKPRHDHGTQPASHHFQNEIEWYGMASSPSFIRQPEGSGMAERFIKTLKEQLLWVHRFKNVEEQNTINF